MDWGNIIHNALFALIGLDTVIYALAAIGLNVHFGYTGLLNFGQAAFLAVGAYGLSISVAISGLPFGVAIIIGLLGAVVMALLLGIPTLRLRADYLAIVTIATAEIFRLFVRSATLHNQTGGSNGLSAFSDGFFSLNPLSYSGEKGLGPWKYSDRDAWVLIVGWSLIVLASTIVWLLMRSPWGRVIKAIREDEDAVRSLGKNVYAYKMQSLIIGGVLGSLGGFMMALGHGSVQPDLFGTELTFFAYTVLLIGGAARVLGPVVGAAVFWTVLALTDNVLRQAIDAGYISSSIINDVQVGQVRFILVGLTLMLLMIFRPQGIFGDRKELALDGR
jgi:neutral amino acid transport system permease protein